MGATAGHMMHPYENLDLTFDQMREIFQAASQGFPKLKVTEKLDGQQIAIGYDPESGQALAIRNKTHAMEGGLDKEKLKNYFTIDRIAAKKPPTPANIVDSFYDAMVNFEKVARSLSPEFFITPEGERIFYNAEVMDPRSPNVIDYDTQVLTIQRVGHKKLSNGKQVSLGANIAEKYAAELEQKLQEIQEESPEISTVKVNAIVNFTDFIEKKEVYRTAINELRAIQGSAKTVGEWLKNRIRILLQEKLGSNYSDETYEELTRALIYFVSTGIPRIKTEIANVLATLPDEKGKQFVKEFLRSRSAIKDVVDRSIKPLIFIVHRFATRILEGFISGYTLQSDVSLEKLRKKIGAKAGELSDPADLEVLKTSLEKIHGGEDVGDILSDESLQSALEKITTSIEGLVFDYNGETYKFTGQFAPVNQMLGLGKYDRGSKGAVSEDVEEEDVEETNPLIKGRTIALIPGAFKPPHAGHFEMVGHYSQMIGPGGHVYVLISPLSRGDNKKQEVSIGFEESRKIWEIYINSARLNNVIIYNKPTESNSPIGQVIEYIENKNNNLDFAQSGDEIILGCSDKADKKGNPDYMRFGDPGSFQKYAREGVTISDHVAVCFKTSEGALSSTNFREALYAGKDIGSFIPSSVNQEEIKSIIGPIQEEKKTNMSLLFSLVEEFLNEKKGKTKVSKAGQKRVSKKIAHLVGDEGKSKEQAAAIAYSMEERGELEELASMAGGSAEGGAGKSPWVNLNKKKKKKNKNEEIIEDVMDYLTGEQKLRSPKNMQAKHEDIASEYVLRENIQKIIKFVDQRLREKEDKETNKKITEEINLRLLVRELIQLEEAAEFSNETPHESTGINVLEDLLKKIVPILEDDYKILTTDEDQRNSFRAHIVMGIKNALTPSKLSADIGDLQEALEEEEIDITIDNKEGDSPLGDEAFIDIAAEKPHDEAEEFGIPGEEETGRNMALRTFKKIEKNIIDAYEILAGDEDRELFYDYLITNVKLYFDKFEDEISTTVPEPTTHEYEQEKDEESAPEEPEEEFEFEI